MAARRRIRRLWPWALGLAAAAGLAVPAWLLLAPRRQPPTVAVIARTCGTWLWEAEHTGVMRAAAPLGLNVYWNAPMREDDLQSQIDIFSRSVDRGSAAVILSPVEALPLRTPVRNAIGRGTPVVVVDTDLGLAPGPKLAYVLNDEQTGGQMAAERLGRALNGRGSVAVVGISKQLTTTAERARSLEAALAAHFPGIHVVYRSLALPTVSQEQQVAEKLLSSGQQIDAIVALTQFSTRGAYYALTEADRTRSTPLIGFDQNILAPIRSGDIDSVIIQNTFQIGREAMRLAAERLHGQPSENQIIVEPILVTRETIDSPQVQSTLDLAWFQ